MANYRKEFIIIKKYLLGFFAFVALSCTNDNATVEVIESVHTEKQATINAKKVKDDVLDRFAKNHVMLSNEILLLLNEEKDLNFDNFPYEELESSNDGEKIQLALANTGMVNHKRIYFLLTEQKKNASILFDKDYINMESNERDKMLIGAIQEAIIQNPINYPPFSGGDNSTLAKTCGQQYVIDREDCATDALINWGILAGSCWFGTPVACAVGGVGVLAISAVCSSRAKRDYNDCLNGK